MIYRVDTATLAGWEDCWTENEGPRRFATVEEAEAAITDHLQSLREAGKSAEREDFRIREEPENRLFARVVGRLEDCRIEPLHDPLHIFGAILMAVPVIPEDTVQDVRDTLTTMLGVHVAGLDYRLSESQTPYTAEDCLKAASVFCQHRQADEIFDSSAQPYDEDAGMSPTCAIVQVIAIDDQCAALDLYYEALGRLEGRETLEGFIPFSYRADTCVKASNGVLYSRMEVLEDAAPDYVDTAETVLFGALFDRIQAEQAEKGQTLSW